MKKLIQNHKDKIKKAASFFLKRTAKGGIFTDRQNLKKREKDFCREYIYCGNPKEAAQNAGYTVFPQLCGIRLLTDRRIKAEIAALEKQTAATRAEALRGYRRIAFGSIADAVKLVLLSDGEPCDAEKLDLFNVAEIKKPRGGGMEVKFFDRLKALERIEELSSAESDKYSMSLYRAIENSAIASSGGQEDDC